MLINIIFKKSNDKLSSAMLWTFKPQKYLRSDRFSFQAPCEPSQTQKDFFNQEAAGVFPKSGSSARLAFICILCSVLEVISDGLSNILMKTKKVRLDQDPKSIAKPWFIDWNITSCSNDGVFKAAERDLQTDTPFQRVKINLSSHFCSFKAQIWVECLALSNLIFILLCFVLSL